MSGHINEQRSDPRVLPRRPAEERVDAPKTGETCVAELLGGERRRGRKLVVVRACRVPHALDARLVEANEATSGVRCDHATGRAAKNVVERERVDGRLGAALADSAWPSRR